MAYIRNYTLGATYRKPNSNNSTFMLNADLTNHCENSTALTKERERLLSLDNVLIAIESGVIGSLDRTILSVVTAFSGGYLSVATLKGLLQLSGTETDEDLLESCIDRLYRYQLINITFFSNTSDKTSFENTVLSLTPFGSYCAKNSIGINHKYNPKDYTSSAQNQIKTCATTAHIIYQFLAHSEAEYFVIRPTLFSKSKSPKDGGVIRPSATVTVRGNKIHLESPRRTSSETWMSALLGKLIRYKLVYGNNLPTIVITCENKEASHECYQFLVKNKFDANDLVFSDNYSQNEDFVNSFYIFKDGTLQNYPFEKF